VKVDRSLGIALGGGGARGLAHLPILEVFDRRGIQLSCIAGTSAGAIIGALYASGRTAEEIRVWAEHLITNKEEHGTKLSQPLALLKNVELFDLSFDQSGLLRGNRFIAHLGEALPVDQFEDLEIPLKVVATDFWSQEAVVFESGNLLEAIRCSMSIPGVFTPVEYQGKVLVDGGAVNPLPHDTLTDCSTVIAVDVTGFPDDSRSHTPSLFQCMTGSFDAMQKAIIVKGLEQSPPNLYLRPPLKGYDLVDFHRYEAIQKDTQPVVDELERWLDEWQATEV
jgi:NTE family protein